jgi:hypothetical protein
MDAWTHQPGFPLITLRIVGQDGEAEDDDSNDDDQGVGSSAPLRLTAQQVGVLCRDFLFTVGCSLHPRTAAECQRAARVGDFCVWPAAGV